MERGAFGDLLRRSREAHGIALGAVAERTRIAARHLEALERSDLDALPAGPFGRSYIRAYAEMLGIDPGPILEAYRAQERQRGIGAAEREQRMLEELSHLVGGAGEAGRPGARLRTRPVRLAATLASVVIVATVGWLLARNGARETPAERPPRLATPSQPTPVSSRPPEVARPRPQPTPPPAAAQPVGHATEEGPAAKAPASSAPTDSVRISEFGVGTDVVDRRLVGRADRFPEGSRVFFWTLVVGGQPGHAIRHVWYQGGRAVMRADLPIGGPHWRTRSTLVLPRGSAGPWTVEARTSDGRLLARNDFVCEKVAPARP